MPEGRLSVGNVEILALNDGEVDFPFPLTDIFPGTTEQAWAQYRQRYPEVFGGPNTCAPIGEVIYCALRDAISW